MPDFSTPITDVGGQKTVFNSEFEDAIRAAVMQGALVMINSGTGTANHLVANVDNTIKDGSTVILRIVSNNTQNVTATLNGVTYSVRTITGDEIDSNGLVAGMVILALVDQTNGWLQMFLWQDASASEYLAKVYADAARDDRILSDQNRIQTSDDVIQAGLYKEAAKNAAEASGDVKFYDTYADADAAISGLPDQQVVHVWADESRGGGISQYRLETGVLEFKVDLSEFDRLMELDLRKPRKLWAKIFRMMSNVDRVHWVSAGDSLASRKFQQIALNLDRMLGANSSTANNPAGNNVGTQGGDQLYDSALVNATKVTGVYGVSPTGSYINVLSGGSVSWIYTGANPSFSRIRIYYVKESGAGEITLTVDGANVASADADQLTSELGILEYDISTTQTPGTVFTSVSGGDVKILGATKFHDDRRGVVKHHLLAAGGINVAGIMQTATSQLIYQQLLVAMTPDIVTLEMDDEFTAPSFSSALETMLDIWDTAAPYADKMLIGSTPRAAGDEDKRLANLHLREVAHRRDTSYLYFDSYTLMGSYSDMTAIFGGDDGVHPNVAAQGFAAEMLWNHLGLNANMGRLYRAIYTPNVPSSFYKAFELRSNINPLTIDGDSAGADWWADFSRSFAFRDLAGNIVARLSSNTAIAPNILPEKYNIGTSGNRRFEIIDEGGSDNKFVNFIDTAAPLGQIGYKAAGVRYLSYSKAAILALTASQHQGEQKFCLAGRADGGNCLVYSDGTSWKRVSDDSLLS